MIDPPLEPKVVDSRTGMIYQVVNNLVTFKAMAADTNGAYALFEIWSNPGEGMPVHRQRYDDEGLWVLEGMYSMQLDDRTVTLVAGDYVLVPRGTLHGYTNSGDRHAGMLLLLTPGGIHERFFAEVGDRVADGNAPPPATVLDLTHLHAVAQKYGIEILLSAT
jgi:quercetin dioxygenase-like cupin family protein